MRFVKYIALVWLSLLAISAQAAQIELNKVDSRLHSKYGFRWQGINIEAVVENLAYEKKVQLMYRDDDGEWATEDLSYSGSIGDGLETWSLWINRNITGPYAEGEALDLEFVLRYEVDGAVYWDNNLTRNYFIPAGSGEYTPKPLLVDTAVSRAPYDYDYNGNTGHVNGYLSIDVMLQNYAMYKDVEIHYSYDNWQTTHIGNASFVSGRYKGYSWVSYPNANDVEVWNFYSAGPEAQSDAESLQFAVKYSVDGQVYWDNNYGQNYSLTTVR
ncbi:MULTISPECIES: carbohydrate-binding protein [Reinekea]|jgi:hypothetical protein|uniref:Glycogen-binding protein regulatory subunit of S/T protein phosphatase I, CBM21 (2x) n=1 Tax=Reinekea forsetii TaxID=1336806 RepID=A0A2K8KT90_9GAMM|nr:MULTISPECIES: carbohydrate-binding protein [Reinekea]ATX77923.1 glycogen-binding protein regulatory subunit of S/T protein phosphatase I, CBM21 (2x) [Reinekea forsetii]MDO7641592.1 CBM21 domain-containing protein [Reinekea forsetii]